MDSDKYSMSKEGDTYVLIVNDVFGEDADEYCVKATTPAGSRASRADLVIKSQQLSLSWFLIKFSDNDDVYFAYGLKVKVR